MAKFKFKYLQISMFLAVCAGASFLGFVLGGANSVIAEGNKKTVIAETTQTLQASDEKVIEWLGISKQEVTQRPYKLENFIVKKSKVTPYKKFNVKELTEKLPEQEHLKAEDWLEGFQFTIRNTADKPVTFILLELGFPETEAQGPKMVYQVKIGLGLNPSPNEIKFAKPLMILPGDSYLFTLSPQHLKAIKDFLALKNFKLEDLNKVEILSDYSIFDDGIKWDHGHFYKPNSSASNGYERMTP
jgi:hypothetical protein